MAEAGLTPGRRRRNARLAEALRGPGPGRFRTRVRARRGLHARSSRVRSRSRAWGHDQRGVTRRPRRPPRRIRRRVASAADCSRFRRRPVGARHRARLAAERRRRGGRGRTPRLRHAISLARVRAIAERASTVSWGRRGRGGSPGAARLRDAGPELRDAGPEPASRVPSSAAPPPTRRRSSPSTIAFASRPCSRTVPDSKLATTRRTRRSRRWATSALASGMGVGSPSTRSGRVADGWGGSRTPQPARARRGDGDGDGRRLAGRAATAAAAMSRSRSRIDAADEMAGEALFVRGGGLRGNLRGIFEGREARGDEGSRRKRQGSRVARIRSTNAFGSIVREIRPRNCREIAPRIARASAGASVQQREIPRRRCRRCRRYGRRRRAFSRRRFMHAAPERARGRRR